MAKTHRSPHTAAIFKHIKDRFNDSETRDCIWINCPVTNRHCYDIYPDPGRQSAGFYIVIDNDVDEGDLPLHGIETLEAAKTEVAERIAAAVEAAQKVLDAFQKIPEPSAEAA